MRQELTYPHEVGFIDRWSHQMWKGRVKIMTRGWKAIGGDNQRAADDGLWKEGNEKHGTK